MDNEIDPLWGRYLGFNDDVETAEKVLKEATAKRSDVLKEIVERAGKGLFDVPGLGTVSIRVRGETYYLVKSK